MAGKKYVAYVGSYSYTGNAKGITIYDVDMKKGAFKKRTEVEVDNSSYLIVSPDGKTLYSVADEGVVAFRILENGMLSRLNSRKINGMRACHLSVDKDARFIFVSGYHDGKMTVLTLEEDGSVGPILTAVYHKGLGSVAERNSRPRISCTKLTPEGAFIMSADPGIDQVSIYRFDHRIKGLVLVDALRTEQGSAPRCFKFSDDGRFLYLMYEIRNMIDVYEYHYKEGGRAPQFERIQRVPATGPNKPGRTNAATSMCFTDGQKYLYCANSGDNSVTLFSREAETGLLTPLFNLPISGEYPKDVTVFPDGKHIVSVNNESGSLSFFKVDYEKKIMVMSSNIVSVNQPNCCVFAQVN